MLICLLTNSDFFSSLGFNMARKFNIIFVSLKSILSNKDFLDSRGLAIWRNHQKIKNKIRWVVLWRQFSETRPQSDHDRKKIVFVCLPFHLGTCWVGPPIDNFFPSSSYLFRLREATFWNVLFPDETGTMAHNFFKTKFFYLFFLHRQNELNSAQTILASILIPPRTRNCPFERGKKVL